jgi:1-aminocyclopropane-1-carboxylate deaminase/D-cysteine desulfhydrase
VWLKRDDIGPVALAGNKVRKYDLVLGEALQDGADLLITAGATQSNSARAGAAAAALLGLECRLLLSGPRRAEPTANLLLDVLLGAQIRHLGDVSWEHLERAVEHEAAEAASSGSRPVIAPVGCSSPLGALGFALAFIELREQCFELGLRPAAIIHASSSVGTHAGLLVGRALVGDDVPILGVEVGAIYDDPASTADALAREAAALVGLELADPGADIRTGFLGPGYAIPDAGTVAAIEVFARTEAVICDPVYSGKGAAGLLGMADALTGPVVFWHTGGYHALFDPELAAVLAQVR